LPADSEFVSQTPQERVISMLYKSYDHFMQAQFFERAVETANKLRQIEESRGVKYEKMISIIELQMNAWNEIIHTERNTTTTP